MHVNMPNAIKNFFFILPDDALKRMECENNLKMFTAIAHLQVLHLKYI